MSFRSLSSLAALWCWFGVLATPSPVSAQAIVDTCSNPGPYTYHDIALRIAPVFWFSPDEPLLGPGRSIVENPLPHRLPTLERGSGQRRGPDTTGIAYYRINEQRLRSEHDHDDQRRRLVLPPGVGSTQLPLRLLSRLEYRFYSYYDEDIGFGNHAHDVEVIDIALDVEVARNAHGIPCERLHVARISSTAHGSDWYTNTLEIDRYVDDLARPLHVLVEEGKHATSPDRNADGLYSPGYDVNRRVADAWGIRDTLRNKRQGGASFHTEGLKLRATKPVRAVPLGVDTTPAVARYRGAFTATRRPQLESATAAGARLSPEWGDEIGYELLEGGTGSTQQYCTGAGRVSSRVNGEGTTGLYRMLARWGFCALTEARGPRRNIDFLRGTGPQGPGHGTFSDRVAVAWTTHAGVDGGALTGLTTNILFGLRTPLVEGWLVPEGAFLWEPQLSWTSTSFERRSRQSAELLYMPSGSRAVDWFLVVGAQRDRRGDEAAWSGIQEVGLKLRAPKRLRVTQNSMLSARLGYRGSLHRGLGTGHWALQLGIGGW